MIKCSEQAFDHKYVKTIHSLCFAMTIIFLFVLIFSPYISYHSHEVSMLLLADFPVSIESHILISYAPSRNYVYGRAKPPMQALF